MNFLKKKQMAGFTRTPRFGVSLHGKRGFTLVEVLVVIAIISLLLSVVMASIRNAQANSRDNFRKTEMKRVQVALQTYLNNYYWSNGYYPLTGPPMMSCSWCGISVNGGSKSATIANNAYINDLIPMYVDSLPVDPGGDTSGWSGFLYRSDGLNYKLLSHDKGPESFPAPGQAFYDPVRPTWAWMVCSGEPACSTW